MSKEVKECFDSARKDEQKGKKHKVDCTPKRRQVVKKQNTAKNMKRKYKLQKLYPLFWVWIFLRNKNYHCM